MPLYLLFAIKILILVYISVKCVIFFRPVVVESMTLTKPMWNFKVLRGAYIWQEPPPPEGRQNDTVNAFCRKTQKLTSHLWNPSSSPAGIQTFGSA